MSYPPPPGLNKNVPSSHPSLPARPPPSSLPQSFKPAHTPGGNSGRGGGFGSFGGFAPRQVAAPAPAYNTYQQPSASYQQPSYNSYATPQPQSEDAYGAAPQIRNPFAPPTQGGGTARAYEEDPEMAAQIAQWQSAYAGKDSSSSNSGYTGPVRRYNAGEGSGAATSSNAAPLGGRETAMTSAAMTSAAHNDTGVASIVADAKTNQKTVVRTGGGTQWTDSTLLEWDPAHFRLFVGNLAGEVTDESLHKAFARWPSLQKARVIRDKRTTKSKAYGFVSFSDGDDMFQAVREMQGKYIGSHPVLLRRSTTEIKAVIPKDNRHGKNKNKGKGGNNNKDKTSAGVQKPGSKTKGGLKILG